LQLITLKNTYTHTHTHTCNKTPLDERSARSRDLYLTKHNTHKRQLSMARRDSKPQSQQSSGRKHPP